MPGLGAPIGALFVDNIIDEAGEFRPERPLLPEEAVDGDSECKTKNCPDDAGSDDGAKGQSNMWL